MPFVLAKGAMAIFLRSLRRPKRLDSGRCLGGTTSKGLLWSPLLRQSIPSAGQPFGREAHERSQGQGCAGDRRLVRHWACLLLEARNTRAELLLRHLNWLWIAPSQLHRPCCRPVLIRICGQARGRRSRGCKAQRHCKRATLARSYLAIMMRLKRSQSIGRG